MAEFVRPPQGPRWTVGSGGPTVKNAAEEEVAIDDGGGDEGIGGGVCCAEGVLVAEAGNSAVDIPRSRTTLSSNPDAPRATRIRQPTHSNPTSSRRDVPPAVTRSNAIGAARPVANMSATAMVKNHAPGLVGLPGSGLGASPRPTLPPRYQYPCIPVNTTAHVNAHHSVRVDDAVLRREMVIWSGLVMLILLRLDSATRWGWLSLSDQALATPAPGLVVVAVTWWPRATSCGTSRHPRTPVPPRTPAQPSPSRFRVFL